MNKDVLIMSNRHEFCENKRDQNCMADQFHTMNERLQAIGLEPNQHKTQPITFHVLEEVSTVVT